MIKRIFLAVFIVASLMTGAYAGAKESDLAGSWYSASPAVLRAELEGYLRNARVSEIKGDITGAIAPHAGFRFSGPVAAYTYKALAGKDLNTVIVVGLPHRRYFPGRIAVFSEETFVTPLGKALIDTDISKKLIAYDESIQSIPQAFKSEQSIEMEIPFIQLTLKDARLVLVTLCDQRMENCRLLADALCDILCDEKNFVLIASSDMSHYLSYKAAGEKDARTIKIIKAFDSDLFYRKCLEESRPDSLMCGYGAVYTVMTVCRRLGADRTEILKYANSGDSSGMKDRVVGYMSAVFVKPEKVRSGEKEASGQENYDNKKKERGMFSQAQKERLLSISRESLRCYLENGKRLDVEVEDEALKQDMGAFVTLRKHGQLRGCIGHMDATGPLYLTIRDMAIAAATEDPRFPPVTFDELDDVDIEISVLSPMKKIDDYNEIEMGKHGVMVRTGWRSGVYLPQVADETGWDREQFMNSLCSHKAGIPADAWKTGACDIYVFTAEVFGEKASDN
ncbi:MAG: hypothetical protein DRP85_02120 [Candidatus Makaraimicrobium thalassicum]|nr:MAG: hypothetical protein DRP85_02120 [Candidatus Omnitrophota bacterium]